MSEMSQKVSCQISVGPETDTHLQNSEEGHLPKKLNGAGCMSGLTANRTAKLKKKNYQ